MSTQNLRVLCIGAGYFAQFQFEAWDRMPGVTLAGICNRSLDKAQTVADKFNIPGVYSDVAKAMDELKPDFVDIITPPETHLPMVKLAADRGIPVICQKALAPTYEEGVEILRVAQQAQIPFMVHENFRFQPWHREIKKLLDADTIGSTLHSLVFRSRMGDGHGPEPYSPRQPYFRDMEKLLVFETGVHYIDTFRYLGGEVKSVFASLRRLNPVIKGEDAGMLFFEFESGGQALWDANRFNESNSQDARYTFGEFLVEGDGGSIRLYNDGRLTVQKLGDIERDHEYKHERVGFAGDCVYATQEHFVQQLKAGGIFETGAESYIKTLAVQEAIYRSAETSSMEKVQVPMTVNG